MRLTSPRALDRFRRIDMFICTYTRGGREVSESFGILVLVIRRHAQHPIKNRQRDAIQPCHHILARPHAPLFPAPPPKLLSKRLLARPISHVRVCAEPSPLRTGMLLYIARWAPARAATQFSSVRRVSAAARLAACVHILEFDEGIRSGTSYAAGSWSRAMAPRTAVSSCAPECSRSRYMMTSSWDLVPMLEAMRSEWKQECVLRAWKNSAFSAAVQWPVGGW